MARVNIGLIVNPMAGIGGRVGLKGSDGMDIQQQARALGAVPEAVDKAERALRRLAPYAAQFTLITYPADMGEAAARRNRIEPWVIGEIQLGKTTAADTRRAARQMRALGVDLLLFAGGDGTARDLYAAIGEEMLVLGIPAGVKIHSGVFAATPERAGDLAVHFLNAQVGQRMGEVMDIDEEAFRQGRVAARLFGYLRIPYRRELVQGAKAASPTTESLATRAIAQEVIQRLPPDWLWILGPGSTTRAIATQLGLEKTLLGVDVIQNRTLIAKDVNEQALLDLLEGRQAKIVLTPIGGQGFILGRGNQPISPAVVRRVGKENLVIVSTVEKIQGLRGAPLRVDSGDPSLDCLLEGYVRVISGLGEELIYKIAA
jgi:predicted polyphosphate/ATP-dependent NAD kinase